MKIRSIFCTLTLLTLAMGFARAEDAPFEITGFQYSRQRMTPRGANLVTANFGLQNIGQEDYTSLRVSIRYESPLGEELSEVGPKKIWSLKAGRSVDITLDDVHIPIFNNYVIEVKAQAKGKTQTWEFFGFEGADNPFYWPKTPHPNSCDATLLGSDIQRARNKTATLMVRVKNFGDTKVKKLTAKIQLLNDSGRGIGKAITKLLGGAKGGRNGELEGGEERIFKVRFKRFPQFKSYSIKLSWDKPPATEMFSGGEFTGANEIEFAHLKFEKKNGALEIKGDVRNGLGFEVSNLRLIFKLLAKADNGYRVIKRQVGRVDGALAANAVKPLSVIFEGVDKFDNFEFETKYDQGGVGTTAGVAATGQLSIAVRDSSREGDDVKIEAVLKNGLEMSVKNIEVTFTFLEYGQSVATQVMTFPATISALSERSCTFTFKNVPEFDEYMLNLKFQQARD